MSENVFMEKELQPDEAQIKEKLRSTYPLLLEIRDFVKKNIGETKEEWKYYGAKYGWTMKTFLKKRNLFFLGFRAGYFRLSFVFGDKAVAVVQESDVSGELKKELSEARKYAEGTGLLIEVKDDTYITDIKKLIEIKHNN